MKRKKINFLVLVILQISLSSCYVSDPASPGIIDNKKGDYMIDIGKGKEKSSATLSFTLNVRDGDSTFKTKNSTQGTPGRLANPDIQSYIVYLIKNATSGGYPAGGDPLGADLVATTTVNKSGNSPHTITLLHVPGSTVSFGSGNYYYIGVRAMSASNGTGIDLIKSDNLGAAWTGTTAATPKLAVSTGAGVQVLNGTYALNPILTLSINVNLDDAVGAKIDSTATIATGNSIIPVTTLQ